MHRHGYRAAALATLALTVAGCALPPTASAAGETIRSEQASFRVETVAAPLENPWGMAFLPDGDILVTERPGRLRLIRAGRLEPGPIAGVPPVFAVGQGGLLDVAIHPDYAENGWLYLSYAGIDEAAGGASTQVARARLGEGRLEDLEVIFRSNAVSTSGVHFGSRLVFGRDGRLFVSHGERGVGERAQDLARHNGKILRLADDGGVPEDNPFVGQADAAPEVYAYGVRNPQGLTLHPDTGALWEIEHGPRGGDEVNLIEPGVNYGWPVISWGIDYSGAPVGEGLREKDGLAQPLYYWDPSIAPSGMAFYQGDAFPEWQGDLFVGALSFQLLARLELDGTQAVAEERLLEGTLGRIRDVEIGADGYVYLLTDEVEGGLYRLVPE
jgi:glucose/arabinose dehydrogenase